MGVFVRLWPHIVSNQRRQSDDRPPAEAPSVDRVIEFGYRYMTPLSVVGIVAVFLFMAWALSLYQ